LGVKMVGSISRERMQKEMSEAMVLAYPISTVNFTEGFSVTTMEAHAAGVVPVLCGCDAIKAIYGQVAPMIEAPAEKHMEEFVALVIKSLTDEKFRKETTEKCKAFAANHTWHNVTKKLAELIEENIKN